MLKCIELDEKLKSMDQEITVNPQFVQKVRTLRRLFLAAFAASLTDSDVVSEYGNAGGRGR